MAVHPSSPLDAFRTVTPPGLRVASTGAVRAQAQPPRVQMRRYETRYLAENGDIRESRHVAPALPLFEDAFCAFARGALIDTTAGPVAIEDLLPGDTVLTSSGAALPVIWIGSTTLVPGHSAVGGRRMHLTRINEGSFGLARPAAHLVVGPAARVLQTPDHLRATARDTRMLTPMQSFTDGVNIIETTPPSAVQAFHLCLPRHAVIRLSGLEFETYHPGTGAVRNLGQQMRDLYLSLFPHVSDLSDFGPLAHMRVSDAGAEDMDAA